MAKKTVRAGIIGSGFAGEIHQRAMERVFGTNVEHLGVWSPNSDNAKSFATRFDVPLCESVDAMIDAADVVHVCTPPAVHEEIACAALARDTYAIVEKPLTGYFGDGDPNYDGRKGDKQAALDGALASIDRLLDAEAKSRACILYAENWVYAPAIQKEREIIEKTGAQILWMRGEEAHSGSHAEAVGYSRLAGGGSLIGKGCHPLTGALYLKRIEGLAHNGTPIRPATASARLHRLTGLPGYRDNGHLRTDYFDTEDFSTIHVTFEDGTVADIFASDIIMGGIHNHLDVAANNHRTLCNINPNNTMETYNPVEAAFDDIYVVEKIGTKQGWAPTAPDEDNTTGFPQEIEAFYRTVAHGEPVQADSRLAADCISTIYSGYLSADRGGAEVPVKAY